MLAASERRRDSVERLRRIGLSCTLLRAVDGHALPRDISAAYSEELNRKTFKRPLSPGEIGCYLSHYEAWKIAAAGTRPTVVLEDDFDTADDLPELLTYLENADLPDAIIKLDATPRHARFIRHLGGRYDLVDPWVTPPLALGYLLTPGAAQILLTSALPFGRPVDMDFKHWWELGVRVLAVSPAPIRERQNNTSQISAGRVALQRQLSHPVRLCRNLRYQGNYHLNLLRARSIGWPQGGRLRLPKKPALT